MLQINLVKKLKNLVYSLFNHLENGHFHANTDHYDYQRCRNLTFFAIPTTFVARFALAAVSWGGGILHRLIDSETAVTLCGFLQSGSSKHRKKTDGLTFWHGICRLFGE